jgi:branched-chain amino acid transport system substrate-binding protein
MKKLLAAFIGIVLILAWGSFDQMLSAAEKPIRIGVLYPLSGHLALFGEESFRGAEIARVMRNNKGGVAGRKIEYVVADIPDANAAKSEAERLLSQEKLNLITGAYASSFGLAASEVVCRKGVVYFSVEGIADQFVERGYKTIFATDPRAKLFSVVQVKFIEDWIAPQINKKPSEIRISFVHEDSAYGSSVARNFEKAAKARKLNLVSVIPYSAKAVDLSSVILNLRKDKAEVVVGVSYATDSILFGRQAKELGLDLKAFIGSGAGHSLTSFQEALGSAVEGVFSVDFTQFEVNMGYCPGLREYIDTYQKMYKKPPLSGHSTCCFVGMNALFDILEKTKGDMDPQVFRKAALEYEVKPGKTANGWGIKFNEHGENIAAEPFNMQWRGGKMVTVWPKGPAVMEPKLIKPFSK